MGAITTPRRLAVAVAGATAAQFVPSVVVLGQWGPWQALPGDLCRWQGPDTGSVALTFDDGPDPDGTPAILDRLDALSLRATFFMLGSQVERYPELAAEVGRRGHQVATHGHRHEHHLWRSPRWVLADLRAARSSMDRHGLGVAWYRPSFGQVAGSTLAAAKALRLRTVLWSCWGREWATDDPAVVERRVSRRLRSGAIVLLHDSDAFGRRGMWRTAAAALEPIAVRLSGAGLRAVTLDELVAGGAESRRAHEQEVPR